ncbi:ABC transporter substrate-binding protein [Ferrimonas lipolytica]|uniref:ABC transporter substrate-binding protein n=1 Tax=Ferrimonas lipolytica TaxID=2724191 RepID=A0A6H1UC74_9GAMM|nr:ABC transporter substrate-binding protein [Ferrimonas lipolytica]QIZ76661.1 ABC transporter substrate-binding protein [Ferrimonas lipolytica]
MTIPSYASLQRKKALFVTGTVMVVSLLLWLVSSLLALNPSGQNPSNTLAISGPWEFTSIEPSKHGYIYTRMQVIETLLNVDEQGNLTSGLAQRWQVSDDGLRWHFWLRNDVLFHDGQPLTAATVINSLTKALSHHGALKRAPIASIEAQSELQLTITLKRPYRLLGALLANYANVVLSPAAFDQQGKVTELIGTGPYSLLSFEPPHKIIVAKYDNYWGHKPTIPFASYLTGHRAESRVLQAKSGNADIVFTVDPATLPQLEDSDNVSVHSLLLPRTMTLKLNSGHPLLNDVNARQALSLALDRQGIAANILHSPGTETEQLLPPILPQWHVADAKVQGQNQHRAKQLLTQLGWRLGHDGVLTRQGQRFTLRLITYADRPELTAVATAIQAQWAEIGIELAVDVTNSSMIPAGHQDGSLEVALMARNYSFIADPLAAISGDFAADGGDWGAMNWSSPLVQQALQQLESVTNSDEDFALSQQIATQIYQQRPVIPVITYSQHTAVNQRVKGFRFDPFERSYFINEMELLKQ